MDGAVLERACASIFEGGDPRSWKRWRAGKLRARPANAADLIVEVRDPLSLSAAERSALVDRCARANMAIYACARGSDDPSIPRRVAAQLGLGEPLALGGPKWDGIARVPWHTEGHVAPPGFPVRATVAHCLNAGAGGEIALLDPELAWLMLRDQGEAFVGALMRRDAFSIPHRVEQGHAVFAIDRGGDLHMRFSESRDTQRWKFDATVSEAAARLRRILDRDATCVVRTRLEAGMGLVSNNVLVTRGMLSDACTRMRLASFRERIHGTEGAWRGFLD